MKELKCPKCGSVFQVDEADYASILSQVKNAEFDAEIHRRGDRTSREAPDLRQVYQENQPFYGS